MLSGWESSKHEIKFLNVGAILRADSAPDLQFFLQLIKVFVYAFQTR